jgi:predicted ATP-grasp superfamily ATP-dependent carboligase|tara:strand:+ start:938 stop:1117 length:180 start_codon:yes stop_codon:yes gene_type:complete
MKTNFKKSKEDTEILLPKTEKKELTKEEFEEYISKSGAKGSFMVYRSTKKDDELGIDEL